MNLLLQSWSPADRETRALHGPHIQRLPDVGKLEMLQVVAADVFSPWGIYWD